MGIDDAARAARDRLDMVNRSAEALERIDEISPRDPDVCDQVGADCRDCEEVLYHPHERTPYLFEPIIGMRTDLGDCDLAHPMLLTVDGEQYVCWQVRL